MNDLLGLVKGGEEAPVNEQEQTAGTSATTSAQQPSEDSASTGRGLLSSLSRKKSKTSGGKSKKRQSEGSSFDIEAPQVTDGKDPDMDQFYAQVALIKALMGDIKEYQKRLENSNEKTKVAVRTAEVHALREQMQQDANTISKEAEQIKTYLKDLDAQNALALKKKGCGRGSASERTRTAITGALKKKLKELMGEFQDLRVKLQNDYKETVERRVYTVTGEHASEEQIERMIDEGEGEMIFQNAIMEQGRGYVLDTLAEIRERRDAVLDLEKSLMELHQIFLDMAVLVEAQGQMIDNIEAQVAKSVEHVKGGVTHLEAAKQSQRKSRKWMCCAIILGLIIIVAVVLASVNSSLAQVETGVTHLAAAKQSQKRSRKMICCILIMILIAAIAVAIILAITLTK